MLGQLILLTKLQATGYKAFLKMVAVIRREELLMKYRLKPNFSGN